LAIAAVLLSTSAAFAQNQQGRGGGRGYFGMQGGSKVLLVQAKPVQEDLKITSEQAAKLTSISDDYRADMRDFSAGEGASREERQQKFEQNREKIATLNRETDKKIDEVLNADQKKRLDEIALQAAGVQALQRDEIAAKLKLTGEQKEKIKKVLDEQSQKMREAFGDNGGGREKLNEIRQQTEQQVVAVLNDDQKKEWKAMQGKEFDLASLRQQRQR
jgi:Spy/CpxP family protein refolding chaperone